LSSIFQGADWVRRPGVATAVTAVLLTVLAVQTARLGWTVFSPIGPVGAPPASGAKGRESADFALLDTFDPFFRGSVATVAAPAAESVALKLFGVRVGRTGSAIIAGADGRQAAYRVGEEVAPGVILQSVAGDHVVLSANGRRTSLFFPVPVAGASGVLPPPYVPPPPVAVTPSASMLGQLGMQSGDVLLSVNGRAVTNAEQAQALARELSANGGDAVVQFERAGQVRTTTVKPSTP
jgi:general secretion pathway protein C